MAVYAVASHGGVYDLWQIKKNIAQVDTRNKLLMQEKDNLAEQINLLQSNNFYIEKIAREELGMARKDDIVVYLRQDNNHAPQFPKVNHSEK
jgi:cell division protein FtsB